MIKTFRSKALAEFWLKGRSAKLDRRLYERVRRRLESLEDASQATDMNVPGFDFHMLKGFRSPRYTVHVNGPWCITFEFDRGNAYEVDLEQYH